MLGKAGVVGGMDGPEYQVDCVGSKEVSEVLTRFVIVHPELYSER